MTVERRYSGRHPVDIRVQIRYRKRRFSCAQALNLSTDGMYVKVQNVTLPTGTLVELELDTRENSWLIRAIVVHRQDAGIGLMFRDPQPRLFDELIHRRPGHFPLRQGEQSGPEPLSKR
jgi:hypothetical protein